jgi:hypothetical protein
MWADVSDAEAETRDDLVDRLHAAGIRYLGGGHASLPAQPVPAASVETLIAGLARSGDARLRTALVALLLRNPHQAPAALRLAQTLDDPQTARYIRVSVLAAAALQHTWAFSLDLYLPGWRPIDAAATALSLGVPQPDEDYGRATLIALDRLLAGADPVPPDYRGAWEDVGRHVMDDLREESVSHATR